MVKKDSLIKGTVILAATALIARVLGIFQRVPLQHAMDHEGNTAFGQANNIYLLLLVFATAGIPTAISKMVSERLVLGRREEVNRIYRAAIRFGVIAGIVMTVLLLIVAPFYAELSDRPGSTLAIQAIAPSLLLFPVIAMMRGYFQGRQFMIAGGISQIVEQIARVVVAVGLVYTLLGWGYSNRIMAAGGALGSVFGSVAAFLVMLWYAYKLRASDRTESASAVDGRREYVYKPGEPPVLSRTQDIYKAIVRISIPILLTAMTVQVIYLIDQTLLIPLSQWRFDPGLSEMWLDVLINNAQSIAGIPPVLAVALSTSLLPIISSAFAAGEHEKVKRQGGLAMRIAVFSGLPVVLVLSIGAYAVDHFLFKTEESDAIVGFLFKSGEGSAIVGLLTAGTIFQITMMTSNAILNGLGKQRTAMRHTLTGVAVKLVLSVALTPFFGVYGLVAATSICFILATVWNMVTIRRLTGIKVLGDRWPGFIAALAVIIAAGAVLVYFGLQWFEPLSWRWPYFFTICLIGLFVCVAYPVLLFALKVIRAEDVESYPARVRKLMRPFAKLQRSRANG
ncbi:polysaccharide biosynthesis protein [Cohnella lubricantis]|uniref:Polysaccharide biosynthesis protein n=1 Tax=Cohnella lubricantis TaxID=2163172 RepID=A0A841TDJ5_9BACL|nr:polysaccharide biosynthesis protein [Cohnella lubricantis]MBB6678286.1 polysaccharide biosynthesis protein [Cohnella lubricantis]MBP2118488.1 stage V sporulation protein B [Cohnella lubricantis]